jgi:hypothetical protein
MKKAKSIETCKTMARVSVPFTEGHYYGKGERPSTGRADNSPFICRHARKEICNLQIRLIYKCNNKCFLLMFQKHNTTLLSTVAISAAVLFAGLFAVSFVHQVLAQSKSNNATAAGGNATASGNTTTGAATKGTAGATIPAPSTSNSPPRSGY